MVYDLFVIGAGSGGVRAARVAARAGAKVAIAEEHRIGGTCVIRGCVPKKLLVYASEFSSAFKAAEGYGWSVEGVRFDWARLRDAVAAEVTRLSSIYARNLDAAGVEIVRDRAEVTGPHTVRLAGSGGTIEAKRILVATGGRPSRQTGLPGEHFAITSNEAFLLPRLPERIVIAGAGYIAVEFATIFSGLGVDTTLVYRGDQILNGFDPDVRAHCHGELARSGVRIVTGAVFERIDVEGAERRVRLTNGETLACEEVMFAVGRRPLTAGLGLEDAGVALNANGGVIVDDFSQTSVPSIFAVGDVTDRLALTPVAIREGEAFARTQFMGAPTRFDHADVPTAVFGRPQVGVVGLSEPEARVRLGAVDIYRTLFRPMKNILPGKDERMLMKLVVEQASGKVVGVHIAGPDAAEMIQLAAIAVKAGLTKAQWDDTCALHPTAAEELVTLREKVA